MHDLKSCHQELKMDSHPFNTGGSSLPLLVSLDSKLRELAYVRRNPIEGRKSVFAHLTRPTGPSSTLTIGMNFIHVCISISIWQFCNIKKCWDWEI